MNRLLCRILLAALLIAAAAAAFYFGYWRGTPNYAAGEIRQAVVNKDYQLFRERVDLRRVYGYALDDIAAEIAETGSTGERFASGFMKALKKPLVDELIRQTEKKFRQDAPESGSPLSVLADTAETYVGSAAISLTDIFDIREENGMTVASVRLRDKDLDRDFIWQVQMEKDVNGAWTAVRVLNLREYLAERKAAEAEKMKK